MIQCLVAAIWPKITRAEAYITGWLRRSLHTVSGGIRKWVQRRDANDDTDLAANIPWHSVMTRHVFVLHAHPVTDREYLRRSGLSSRTDGGCERKRTFDVRLEFLRER